MKKLRYSAIKALCLIIVCALVLLPSATLAQNSFQLVIKVYADNTRTPAWDAQVYFGSILADEIGVGVYIVSGPFPDVQEITASYTNPLTGIYYTGSTWGRLGANKAVKLILHPSM